MPGNGEQGEIEPYKLSEIFSIIPEYDGNQIFIQTFLNSCRCAFDMAIGNQKTLLTLHIKNKLRGKAAELVNSRNPSTWEEIKSLLETHFGDSRDLTSLIQDLQRISQTHNESALNFVSRLQTHNAKMHASVQKQNLTADQKTAQSNLIETMTLNTLLTGLDPKLGSIIRASNPQNMLQAISRIKRELQLSYFESQKFPNKNFNSQMKKPQSMPQKQCSFCKRVGHLANECRSRQQTQTLANGFQNFSRPNFQVNNNAFGMRPQQPQASSSNFQRPQFNGNQIRPQVTQSSHFNNNNSQFQRQNMQPNRPSVLRPNPNYNQSRPPIIQQNPNFNQRTHHVNTGENYYQDFYCENPCDNNSYNYSQDFNYCQNYDDNNYFYDSNQYNYSSYDDNTVYHSDFSDNTGYQEEYGDNTAYHAIENVPDVSENITSENTTQNFHMAQIEEPPDLTQIENQIQTLNLGDNQQQTFI